MTDQDEQRRHWAFQDKMLTWILSLLSAAIVASIGWMFMIDRNVQTLNERARSTKIAVERIDGANLAQDRQLAAQDARIRALESIAARQDERWRQVSEALERIDGTLRKLTGGVE